MGIGVRAMKCPDHGEHEHDTCPGCTLAKLRVDAQAWYETLPHEKKAVLVRQRKVRELRGTKLMWAYFTGCGSGLTLGGFLGLNLISRTEAPDPRYFSLAAVAGIILTVGFSVMRSRVHEELCKLEIDRDHEEIQNWDKK